MPASKLEESFVVQQICTDPSVRAGRVFPIATSAEVSRVCVPKEFRRRAQDVFATLPANSDLKEGEWRRLIPNMILGLIRWLVDCAYRYDLTHWCAVMEPQLLRLLARLGIHFEPLGELVEYHGVRQPCFAAREVLLDRLRCERPDIWTVVDPASPRGSNIG
jgi:N-acyl amino acid synthase of PEP-CTERM/exosortase system